MAIDQTHAADAEAWRRTRGETSRQLRTTMARRDERRLPLSIFRLMLLVVLITGVAHAEPIKIVALGGSNTYGKGVSRDEAYPAQLERLLRAAGYDVVVKNEGTNGQTTVDELGKVNSAVPDGVKIVIFAPGGNDNRINSNKFAGNIVGNSDYNIRTLVQKLLDRHILVLFSGRSDQRRYIEDLNVAMIPPIRRLAPETERQAGDKEHLTPNGYKMVAERMLPHVEKLINQVPKER
jgi:acyl-CoA thioesterase I